MGAVHAPPLCSLSFFYVFVFKLWEIVSSKSKKQSKETKSHRNEVGDPLKLHEFDESPLCGLCLPLLSSVFTSFFSCQLVVVLRIRWDVCSGCTLTDPVDSNPKSGELEM